MVLSNHGSFTVWARRGRPYSVAEAQATGEAAGRGVLDERQPAVAVGLAAAIRR